MPTKGIPLKKFLCGFFIKNPALFLELDVESSQHLFPQFYF